MSPYRPPAPGQPPPPGPAENITTLLLAWSAGDTSALDALLPAVYAELHRQAERAMRREPAGHTLQPTALIHEAYQRLVDHPRVSWQSRTHFFGVAARCMRQVLVDHARARTAAKRGGGEIRVTLSAAHARVDEPAAEILELHEALERLATVDPDQVRLVELRYFAGLTIEETAAALGVSPATVKRDWAIARAWLRRELADHASGEAAGPP